MIWGGPSKYGSSPWLRAGGNYYRWPYRNYDLAQIKSEEIALNAGRFTSFTRSRQAFLVDAGYPSQEVVGTQIDWIFEQGCVWNLDMKRDDQKPGLVYSFEDMSVAVLFKLTFVAAESLG